MLTVQKQLDWDFRIWRRKKYFCFTCDYFFFSRPTHSGGFETYLHFNMWSTGEFIARSSRSAPRALSRGFGGGSSKPLLCWCQQERKGNFGLFCWERKRLGTPIRRREDTFVKFLARWLVSVCCTYLYFNKYTSQLAECWVARVRIKALNWPGVTTKRPVYQDYFKGKDTTGL